MTDRTIHAIGHSARGAFIDFVGDPVAILVTLSGDIILGSGAIPGLPTDAMIHRSRVGGFDLGPSDALGDGWVLSLTYGDPGSSASEALGIWKGSYTEIWEWFVRVSDLVGKPVQRSRSTTSSAITRILRRGEVRAVPGWAMSSAAGNRTQAYLRPWMDAFLTYICEILTKRYAPSKPLTHRYTDRNAQETWVTVFRRLTPLFAEHTPERGIEVCFEPLFLSPPRVGIYGAVTLGHMETFAMIYRASNARMGLLADRLRQKQYGSVTNAIGKDSADGTDYKLNELFEELFADFNEVALSSANAKRGLTGSPLRVLSQIGTVSDEVVVDLVAEARIPQKNRLQTVDAPRLIDEMKRDPNFVLFCDELLVADIRNRWAEFEAEDLEALLFPLQYRIPVGLPFAAGDAEWGGVLSEAMHAVAQDEDPAVRASWRQTLAEFAEVEIRVSPEFLGSHEKHSADAQQ